jgi:hypothetical protein
VRLHDPGIGAEIMGAGKFGPPGWHEDPEWKGAWGPNPPFHTPTFILTHRSPSASCSTTPAAYRTTRRASTGRCMGPGRDASAYGPPRSWSA